MKDVIFVSYWTSKYEKAAKRLKASLDKFGCVSDIREILDAGWVASVRYKPTFIRKMLAEHPDCRGVVWIDADGDVVARPELFGHIEEDLCCRFLHWNTKNVDELLSGTVWVKNSPEMIALLDRWIAELAKAPMTLLTPEQAVLHNMVDPGRKHTGEEVFDGGGVKIRSLPEPYCRIIGRDGGRRGVPSDSVIVHYQFSRETRYGRSPAAHLSEPTKVGGVRADAQKAPTSSRQKITLRKAIRTKPVARAPKARRQDLERERVPDSVKSALRRRRIKAMREKTVRDEVERVRTEKMISLAAGYRTRLGRLAEKRLSRIAKLKRPGVEVYSGGVVGHPPTVAQVRNANAAMSELVHCSVFDGVLPPEQMLLVAGNSPTVELVPDKLWQHVPVVGCNRALRYRLWPSWLFIADREPYCQERDSGRLLQASRDVNICISDSVFAPDVLLRGPKALKERWAQPVPDEMPIYLYRIGPRRKKWTYRDVLARPGVLPINTYSFEAPVASCLNVVGSMLQAAMILGASKIGVIGVELKWPQTGKSHFFGDGKKVGAYPQDGSIEIIVAALRRLKSVAEHAGVEIVNLSPVRNTPFSTVFKHRPIEKWGAHALDRPRWGKTTVPKVAAKIAREDAQAISLILCEAEEFPGPGEDDAEGDLREELVRDIPGAIEAPGEE
uniref:Putative methyltransferase n=1 Tax=viral metagenome TaxID=1070528 RepID=A0A6M3K7K9_9ZZZZ